jgi:hypothetical protein
MKKLFLGALLLLYSSAWAESDSTKNNVVISGYVDIYYGYDFGNPSNHERPSFVYNQKRVNEVNLNLGYLKASYQSENVRANLALMGGTYAQYNLASEQGLLKNIYEANAGIRLSAKKQLWLEAGIFASHIGFESAVSKDCWTLTRSIMAENSPYYESGAKLTYTTDNKKWLFSGMILNGWQRIQRVAGNNTPAFGTQISFKPTQKITLNSSTFFGSDKPDSSRQMRLFHNYYGIFQITSRWGIITGFDIGAQQKQKGSDQYNVWYSPVVIVRYNFTEKLALAARAEYYNDPKGVIILTNTPNGFKTFGYSANIDYSPIKNVVVRLEGKVYNSKDKIFTINASPTNKNYCITSSIAVAF